MALSTEPLGFFALDLIRHCDQRYWLGRDSRQWRCALVSKSFGLNQADPQTVAQIGFIANVVRLYRGEEPDFTLGGSEDEAKLNEVFGTKPKYVDVPGLCHVSVHREIEAQGRLTENLPSEAQSESVDKQ